MTCFQAAKPLLARVSVSLSLLAVLAPVASWAGVANTPHFVSPGQSAIGFEPELTLTNGAGLGFNARYQHGVSDLNNLNLIIGSGGGPRKFRVGGNFTFDFFPDIEGQPGIGIAGQGIYWNLKTDSRFELTGIPYVHKTFATPGGEVEPYFAFPFGLGFSSGTYQAISNVAVGALFKTTEKFRYLLELGINVNHSDSYVSGGIVYYP